MAGAVGEANATAPKVPPAKSPLDPHPYPKHPSSTTASSATPDGSYVYVMDENGAVRIASNGPHMHPKVLGGGQAASGAGEITIKGGKVTELNNLSGTFKHGPDTLPGVRDALKKQGVRLLMKLSNRTSMTGSGTVTVTGRNVPVHWATVELRIDGTGGFRVRFVDSLVKSASDATTSKDRVAAIEAACWSGIRHSAKLCGAPDSLVSVLRVHGEAPTGALDVFANAACAAFAIAVGARDKAIAVLGEEWEISYDQKDGEGKKVTRIVF